MPTTLLPIELRQLIRRYLTEHNRRQRYERARTYMQENFKPLHLVERTKRRTISYSHGRARSCERIRRLLYLIH